MPHTEQQLRQEMVRIGRMMSERGWIAACDGNLSTRLPGGRILVTPAGACKGLLQEDDPIVCNLDGKKIEGTGKPSSEIHMHLTIYQMREDVSAVVHAHPPTATGFAAAGKDLNLGLLPEVIVGLGLVPLAPYGTPGTPALGESLLPYVERHDAALLANHGAVAWGEDLMQAFFRMDKVEHFARITLVAELLGGGRALPRRRDREAVRGAGTLRDQVAHAFRAGQSPGRGGSAGARREDPDDAGTVAGADRGSAEGSGGLLGSPRQEPLLPVAAQ